MSTIAIGSPVPATLVTDQTGKSVGLGDFAGKNIVLYFYPKDDTPGCTIEACDFRDNLAQFTGADTVVLGVSTDDEASHKAFIAKYELNFPLLADTKKELATAFGVLGANGYASRSTFLIDKKGIVRKAFPSVNPKGHAAEVKAALAELA